MRELRSRSQTGAARFAENQLDPWRYLDELTVRMPLPDEVKTLRLLPGTPLTSVLRTYYDNSGNPFEVARYILPGDRTTLVYEGRLSKARRRTP